MMKLSDKYFMKMIWLSSVFILTLTASVLVIGNFFSINTISERAPANIACRITQMSCNENNECCSGNCNDGVCETIHKSAKLNGQNCLLNQECLSSNCSSFKICAPSEKVKSKVGEFCLSHNGCKSNTCDARSRICRTPSSLKY